jgi:hypothetical protein
MLKHIHMLEAQQSTLKDLVKLCIFHSTCEIDRREIFLPQMGLTLAVNQLTLSQHLLYASSSDKH